MTPDLSSELTSTDPVSLKDTPASRSEPGKPRWICFLVLIVVSLLPYLYSLRNDFVYDDIDQVLVNPYLRDFHHLREIFTTSVWSFVGDFRGSTNYYRPVMSLGYLFCYQLFGPHALGFHLANILANVAVVLLVFLVTLKMFRSQAVALAAACLFALHPIHSEAVNWIAAVTELELALFYLLTFWLFLASARAGGKVSAALQIAMAGSFVLTMLSKEQALTLPVVAAIYEHFFRDDREETSRFQKIRRYGSLWLLSAAYLLLRVRYLGGLAPNYDWPNFGTKDTLIAALALIGKYCWKLVWPAELCVYYVFPDNVTALYPWALRGVVALAICLWAFVTVWKSNRQAAFGIVWLLAGIAPVLNIHWMSSNPFAERYLYLPSVGFCWLVGWAAVEWRKSLSAREVRWRKLVPAVAALLAIVCAIRIIVRDRDWRDNVTLYTATLAVSPNAYYIHNNLGTVYWGQGNVAAAASEWATALRLAPNSEYALHNLGLAAHAEKHYQEARIFFLRAIVIRPNYMDAHLDLGKTDAALGRTEEAEREMRTAVELSPLSVRAHNALSEFCFDQRKLPEAEAEARRSVAIEPTPQGYWDLGLPLWLKGDRAGAEHAFLGAEQVSPADSRTHFMLGLFYMDSNRNADALREYRAGLQLDPGNADALTNLKKLEFLGD